MTCVLIYPPIIKTTRWWMMRLIAPFLASVVKKKHTDDLQQLKVTGVRVETMQLMCAGGSFGSQLLQGWWFSPQAHQKLLYSNCVSGLALYRHHCRAVRHLASQLLPSVYV